MFFDLRDADATDHPFKRARDGIAGIVRKHHVDHRQHLFIRSLVETISAKEYKVHASALSDF